MKPGLLIVGIVAGAQVLAVAATAQSMVGTLAGTGAIGQQDGPAAAATFNNPRGLAQDAAGNIYVADTFNHAIRKISPTGTVTTLAGNGGFGYFDATPGTLASFNSPMRLVVDAAGNVYITDSTNGSIRRIDSSGAVTTFAGHGQQGYVDGPAALARFNSPTGIALDGATGALYIVDTGNYRVRYVTAAGTVSTLAGSGVRGMVDGPAASARFMEPQGAALDAQGNLYIADRAAHRIRKLTPAGVVSTLAGSGTAGYADGPAATARFNSPVDVAVDASGAVYVTDRDNYRIRLISPTGQVSTVAGTGQNGWADGPAGSAAFSRAYALLLRGTGLLVADAANQRLRTLSSLGPLAAAPAAAALTQTLVISNFPNPFEHGTTLVCRVPPGGGVLRIELFNSLGARVWQREIGRVGPGTHQLPLPGLHLPAGRYLCRATMGAIGATHSLLVQP